MGETVAPRGPTAQIRKPSESPPRSAPPTADHELSQPSTLRQENMVLGKAVERLQGKVADSEMELEELRTRIDELEPLQDRNRVLEAELLRLKRTPDSVAAERAALAERRCELWQARCIAESNRCVQLRDINTALRNENAGHVECIHALEGAVIDQRQTAGCSDVLLEDRLRDLQKENRTLNGDLQEQAAHLQSLEQQRADDLVRIAQLEDKLERTRQQLQEPKDLG